MRRVASILPKDERRALCAEVPLFLLRKEGELCAEWCLFLSPFVGENSAQSGAFSPLIFGIKRSIMSKTVTYTGVDPYSTVQ